MSRMWDATPARTISREMLRDIAQLAKNCRAPCIVKPGQLLALAGQNKKLYNPS
jgi:hypothetical protein